MSKKYRDKTSKIRIPIKKNAKTIMMGNEEITIPILSIYHTHFFKNLKADNFFEIIYPLVDKIYNNPNKAKFSFIILKLLEHNGVLVKEKVIDGELFKLDDVEISDKRKFIVDDIEYEFADILPRDDIDFPLSFLSKKLIGDKVDFSTRGISFDFMKVYHEYVKDVYVIGSEGSNISSLGNLLDLFSKGVE